MRTDREHTGRMPRRNPSVPVPGMPYRFHADGEEEPPAAHGRGEFEFIESRSVAAQKNEPAEAYNPWEEMGWEGGETAFPVTREPEVLQEEKYFRPMLDLNRELPDAFDEYSGYDDDGYTNHDESYTEFGPDAPDIFAEPPPPPIVPMQEKKREPWRVAVILSCVAALLFCAVEIYRIARDVVQSDALLKEYRDVYLNEHNVDFSKNAQAVALRPAGETYPPTASPVPVITPSPTPRIKMDDPLAGVRGDGVIPGQSAAPGAETPAPRYTLDRYPGNPLLIVREEVAALRLLNEDAAGRLTIDGVLDETVVMRNNTYYLNHNASGDYSGYGAVFVEENQGFRNPPENIVLYGRTSYTGKTFAPLKDYVSQGFGFAQQHAFLTFSSMYEEARYVMIAVISSSGDPAADDYFNAQVLSFETDEEMLAFANEAIGRSLYHFGVSVQASDPLLTLVTLSDGTDLSRIIIVCRMLRENEGGYIENIVPSAP